MLSLESSCHYSDGASKNSTDGLIDGSGSRERLRRVTS